jgi:hypothetical protein
LPLLLCGIKKKNSSLQKGRLCDGEKKKKKKSPGKIPRWKKN